MRHASGSGRAGSPRPVRRSAGRFATIILGLASAGAVLVLAREGSGPHGSATAARPCADCHAPDVPRVHSPGFVRKDHAEQAALNAASCTTCHWESSCNDCHSRPSSAPRYHTAAFRKVEGEGRMQHAMLARTRPDSCVTCHAHRAASTCGRCHKLAAGSRSLVGLDLAVSAAAGAGGAGGPPAPAAAPAPATSGRAR
jgi:hypothetical protein